MGSDQRDTDVLYSHLLQLAHGAPSEIERVELSAEHTVVAVLRDGSRLRARPPRQEAVLDLESLLSRAGVEVVRQ